MEIAELPGSLKTSVMIHCFRVFNVNWLIGKEGHSELRVFYLLQVSTPEKHELFIYIFVTYSCHFCLSDQSPIQNKQQGRTIHYFLMTHYFSGPEIPPKLGAQC